MLKIIQKTYCLYCCCCFQFQFTPLHKAERRNHQSIIKLLVDHKARPTFQQPVRNMPLNVCIISWCLFVCLFQVSLVVFCFVFQEISNGFCEVFFSLHSRRFREPLLVLVTQSRKRDGREKNNAVFLLFLLLKIAKFRSRSGSQNRGFVVNTEREP